MEKKLMLGVAVVLGLGLGTLTGMMVCSRAHAETYGTVALGKSRFSNPEKVWQNFAPTSAYGYGTVAMEVSNSWAIGVGRRFDFGSVDVRYQDFGETKSYAAYPYDPGSQNLPSNCNYPCTPPQWVYHYGTAQGITVAGNLEEKLGKKTALYARAGLTFYRATFEYHIADPYANPDERVAIEQKWPTTYGISPAYGFGLRHGWLFVEFMRHADVSAKHPEHKHGNFQRIDSVLLGLQAAL